MRIALPLDESELADPHIGLAQRDAMLFGEPHKPLAGAVHQPRIGWKAHRLRLHCRIHNDLGKVSRLRSAAADRSRQAFLQKPGKLFFPSAGRPHPAGRAGFPGQLRPCVAAQRVIDERSKGSLCWKNSSPQKN